LTSQTGGSLLDALDFYWPSSDVIKESGRGVVSGNFPMVVCMVLLLVFIPVSIFLKNRTEVIQSRNELASFPLFYKNWLGRQGSIDANILLGLKLSDHFIADYHAVNNSSLPVNLYVAFYASQRKGASVHSPRSCIPGGGWEIQSVEQRSLEETFIVNRVLIQKIIMQLIIAVYRLIYMSLFMRRNVKALRFTHRVLVFPGVVGRFKV